jgi:hypothetical protein
MIYEVTIIHSVTVSFDAIRRESLPIQDEPEGLKQLVYDWDMRLIMNDERLQTVE